ncbi:MAG: DUF2961 domain-containing protein [Chthonomonadales bacterium]|nr:DUF2961 domain-containing protein [Chthonomonadales bacterium]
MLSNLANLAMLRDARSGRASSFDRSGGNEDFVVFAPGETRAIAEIGGAGCIRHIWMTTAGQEKALHRRWVIRMYWDGETSPSVECPLGDFFGMGFGMTRDFVSAPLQMSPGGGRGMNCWFPMPFSDGAVVTITNDGDLPNTLYYYVDYEQYDRPIEGLARFHAQWRRENPTDGWMDPSRRDELQGDVWKVWKLPEAMNPTGEGNYVILEAEGRGHYVGCNLHIDVFERQVNDWYGEGDDMIFVDGEPFPTLHGTGTEDYFCMAYCPQTEYCAPYHGLILYSGTPDWPWKGKNSMYRYHIEDPIHFRKSIKVTIEHGHANKLSNDYSSTAYWYQLEPHRAFPPLLPVGLRLPRE